MLRCASWQTITLSVFVLVTAAVASQQGFLCLHFLFVDMSSFAFPAVPQFRLRAKTKAVKVAYRAPSRKAVVAQVLVRRAETEMQRVWT